MKYIFNNNEIKGQLPIDTIQIAFYDMTRDGGCFDESFINPNDFNVHYLTYIDTEENKDDNDRTRIFINMINGKTYELIAKEVDKNKCRFFNCKELEYSIKENI